MAFIRNYQMASRAARGAYWAGDPLFGIKFKLPKIKPLKLLAAGASFVPGPVGAIAKVGKLAKVFGAVKTAGKLVGAGAAIGAGTELATKAMGGGFAGPGFANQPFAFPSIAGTSTDPATGLPRMRKRYRRMNVTNMKALTRASRRVHKFAKLARRCLVQTKTVRCPRKGARGRKC